MESVSGSQLTFISSDGRAVNLSLTPDGTDATTVAGAFNIEVFTSTAGAIGAGFDASALIQGAVRVSPTDVQAAALNSTEQLLGGSFTLIDRTGGESITLAGSARMTVVGSKGDTIIGSTALAAGQELIDLSGTDNRTIAGPMTVRGGFAALLVKAGAGDSITGGSAPQPRQPGGTLYVVANTNDTIEGGAGAVIVFGGTKAADGSTLPGGRSDLIIGGGGSITVDGGSGDTILGNTVPGLGTTTVVNLSGRSSISGGVLDVENFGTFNTVLGGGLAAGAVFIDDGYNKGGSGNNLITGGSGGGTFNKAGGENTFIIGAPGDTINGGAALTYIEGSGGSMTITGGSGTVAGVFAGFGKNPGEAAINTAIVAGKGDSIVGGAGATYIDAGSNKLLAGATIQGGAGAMTVFGGSGDAITGGTGSLTLHEDRSAPGGGESITGGSGNLFVFAFGKNETIQGGSGTNQIDSERTGGSNLITGGGGTVTGAGGRAVNTLVISDAGDTVTGGTGSMSVLGGGGGATINAGTGGTTVEGGNQDVIFNNGAGTLLVDITASISGAETVNLGVGHGATTLRDASTSGGTAATTVSTFSPATDTIASKTSVSSTNVFLGTSAVVAGNLVLNFLDSTTMTLVGMTSTAAIKFTQ